MVTSLPSFMHARASFVSLRHNMNSYWKKKKSNGIIRSCSFISRQKLSYICFYCFCCIWIICRYSTQKAYVYIYIYMSFVYKFSGCGYVWHTHRHTYIYLSNSSATTKTLHNCWFIFLSILWPELSTKMTFSYQITFLRLDYAKQFISFIALTLNVHWQYFPKCAEPARRAGPDKFNSCTVNSSSVGSSWSNVTTIVIFCWH